MHQTRTAPTGGRVGIRYDDLGDLVSDLESRIPADRPLPSEVGVLVRNIPARTPVQAYGLSKHTAETTKPLPIVVAVGINYSQGGMACPRDGGRSARVVDGLGNCRNKTKEALSEYRKFGRQWADTGCASSPTIDVPNGDDFHLVMTNFCLWVTNKSWADHTPEEKRILLLNNPSFDGQPTCSPNWAHLSSLDRKLRQYEVVWVPHGILGEVPELFRDFAASNGANWILAPNLSRPYRSYGIRFPRTLNHAQH
jgi:hypothetical protein